MMDGPLFLSLPGGAAEELSSALGVTDRLMLPAGSPTGDWEWDWAAEMEAWRAEAWSAHRQAPRVVVCAWPAEPGGGFLLDVTTAGWLQAVEWRLALGFTALQLAARFCADGGSVVLVVERPVSLDAAGHAPLVTVAEGLITAARSLAFTEGVRGVRVNTVATEVLTAPERPVGSAPPLASFPGTARVEVAGAVRVLLSDDSCGITGTVVCADGGRSW